MDKPRTGARLDVESLLAHGSLRGSTALHLTPVSAAVEQVTIVTDPAAIQRIRPNTVVVLSSELGSGGWQVSVALRYAWERRASAVVAAYGSHLNAVVGLARRLDITLLATRDDPAAVALALAGEIGAALSVVDADLARFVRAVAKEISLTDVLRVISRELDGIEVTLAYAGTALASAGSTTKNTTSRVAVDVRGAGASTTFQLVADLPRDALKDPRFVQSVLEVAAPSVQASWLHGNSLETAAAVPTAALAALPRRPGVPLLPGGNDNDYGDLLKHLGWRGGQRYVAVWFSPAASPDGPDLTAILRLLWRKVTTRHPLAETTEGWVALVPCEDESDAAQLETRIGSRLGTALRVLGLTAGLSRRGTGNTGLQTLVHEARLAAQCADRTVGGLVQPFAHLGLDAASCFVDEDSILLVAELAIPRLLAAPDRDSLVETLAAFLDHRGSVSGAAKALDLHRNTLQARLNRVRDLDVPLDDPARMLSVHLIFAVLRRKLRRHISTTHL